LNVTPAGSLRIWKAIGNAFYGANYFKEPGMQADQWGVAASLGERCTVERGVGRRWLCSAYLSFFSGRIRLHFVSLSQLFEQKIGPEKMC